MGYYIKRKHLAASGKYFITFVLFCWANNDGCCCVRVGSGVQTNAATPNNVGI